MYVCVYLLLALSHGKELEPVSPKTGALGQLHQVTGRLTAWTQDKDDGGVRGALLKYCLETDHWRLYIPEKKI